VVIFLFLTLEDGADGLPETSVSILFYFFTNLIHLILHLQSLVICLYMFRTGRPIIRKIKCLITQAASGTVPSVVDLPCVAVGVLTPAAKHDRSTTDGTVSEAACVIKHLILLMMGRPVRNM
jgi:hypothetical protein